MSFQIDRGLFLPDFSDFHAVLGVPLGAEVKDIRKQYLKIARRLHPDSCAAEHDCDKQLAAQLLSKLVNPAWQHLSQEKTRVEYLLILKMKGQGAAYKRDELDFGSSLAQQLLSSSNSDYFYRTALQDLSTRQYEQLDQTIELTAQISELNLAYLISKEGTSESSAPKSQIYTTTSSTPAATKAPTQPAPPPRESLSDQYYRRAEGFMAKGNYAQATLELRDALKIEPNSSRCHSLMGMVYLRQNQPTMARIHFNKALSIDPQNAIALEGKQKLEPPAAKLPESKPAAKPTTKPTTKPSGSLFGGLFGKKK